VDGSIVRIVTPGVDSALLKPHRQASRAALRQRWNVSDETLLVGLLGDPVSWSNARAAASIVTLPVTANRDVKLLVHPDAWRLQAAHEWSRPLAEPWQVLAGLDAALWLGASPREHGQPTASVLPMVWAMAAGLPVLAERCAAAEESIREGGHGLMFEPGDLPAGAKHVIALHDDAALRRRFGDAGRRAVAAQFSIAQAAQGIDDVYSELIGDHRHSTRASRRRSRQSLSSATAAS
jgi:hypothetical protein